MFWFSTSSCSARLDYDCHRRLRVLAALRRAARVLEAKCILHHRGCIRRHSASSSHRLERACFIARRRGLVPLLDERCQSIVSDAARPFRPLTYDPTELSPTPEVFVESKEASRRDCKCSLPSATVRARQSRRIHCASKRGSARRC